MRRVLVAVATILLVGQVAGAAEWRLGLQAGLNGSGLQGDSPRGVSLGHRMGLIAGAMAEFRVAEDVWLGIQPGYMQRGATSQLAISGQSEKVDGPTVELGYVGVPILARVVANNGRTYVTGGLNLGFLVGAETVDGDQREDISSLLRDFDIAADIGFGLLVPVGSPLLSFELRYEQSILNLAAEDREAEDEVLPVRFRSSGFQVLVGVLMPLGAR